MRQSTAYPEWSPQPSALPRKGRVQGIGSTVTQGLPGLLCAILAGSAMFIANGAHADELVLPHDISAESAAPLAMVPAARKVSPFRSMKMTEKAKNQYVAKWGVDKLRVSYTMSGNLIRFSYRVVEPQRAKALADKGATPYLMGLKSRAVLEVPVMDKVGPLRQSSTPKSGLEYWMVFSNKGNLIKPGDRVNVMIGAFRADGLMVD
jgi:hypothetical protein